MIRFLDCSCINYKVSEHVSITMYITHIYDMTSWSKKKSFRNTFRKFYLNLLEQYNVFSNILQRGFKSFYHRFENHSVPTQKDTF